MSYRLEHIEVVELQGTYGSLVRAQQDRHQEGQWKVSASWRHDDGSPASMASHALLGDFDADRVLAYMLGFLKGRPVMEPGDALELFVEHRFTL